MRKILQSIASRFRRPRSKTTVLLSLAVAVLLALNVYQYAAGVSLRAQLQASSPQPSVPTQVIPLANIDETNSPQYDAMIAVLKDAGPSIERLIYYSDIYYSNAFFVPSDASMLYHRYNCPAYDSSVSHYIMNKNFAESEGYSPCSLCVDYDSIAFDSIFYGCFNPLYDLLDLIQYGSESDWMEAGAALTAPTA